MHKYRKGQRVYWQDPDNGTFSGDYTISSDMSAIYEEHPEEDDIIVTIVNGSSEVEVPLSEIKPVTRINLLKDKLPSYKK